MRRAVVASVLVAAVVIGVGAGIAVHRFAPGPFTDTSTSPSPSASAVESTATPPASSTPSPSPTPTPTPSTPGPSQEAPAFTRLALLQAEDFTDHGWAVARVIDTFDTPPAAAITPCASVAPDEAGLIAGFAATYASERTEAAEIVVRLDSEARAKAVYQRLRALVAGCAELRITTSHHPASSEVSDLRWWNTRGTGAGATRGVIGLVRADDRIALVSMRSDVSDPAETTRVEGLLTQAGRRLV